MPLPESQEEPEPDIRTLTMTVTGNIMTHQPQINQARTEDGHYDFSPSFDVIAPYLQSADFTVGDLEVAQAGPDISYAGVSGYTGFPYFNAPQSFSEALYEAGMNVFTLANNHALDRGYEGLLVTLDHLRGLGADTFGAYSNWEERDNPLILEKDGIRIALIGYTYSTNGIPIPEGHEYCVNYTPHFEDISPVLADIRQARANGADLVAVFPHWGAEHVHEPQPQRLRDAAAEMAAAGADLVLGGHPKFIQPLEWFFHEEEDGSERATLAVYSQGNFISNQHEGDGHNYIYSEFGLLLNLELSMDPIAARAWISAVDYDITWVHRNWRHRVLPLSAVLDASPEQYNLSEAEYQRLQAMHETSRKIIDRYGYEEGLVKAMDISGNHLAQAGQKTPAPAH